MPPDTAPRMPPPSTTTAIRAPAGRSRRARATGWPLRAEPGELVVGELDIERAEILTHMLDVEGAGDRQHDRRALQQPGELDLMRRRSGLLGDLIDRGTVAPPQREEGDEEDLPLGAVVHDLVPLARAEVVLVLNGGDRHHRLGELD